MRMTTRAIGTCGAILALVAMGGCRRTSAIMSTARIAAAIPDSTRGDTAFYTYSARGMPAVSWRTPVRLATFDGCWHEENPRAADESDRWEPIANLFVLVTCPTADSLESARYEVRAQREIVDSRGRTTFHVAVRSSDPAVIGTHRFDVTHTGGPAGTKLPSSVPMVDFLRRLDSRPDVFQYAFWVSPCRL